MVESHLEYFLRSHRGSGCRFVLTTAIDTELRGAMRLLGARTAEAAV